MDGQNPHRIIIGLGRNRFGDSGHITRLDLDPIDKVAEVAGLGFGEQPGLLRQETVSAQPIPGAGVEQSQLPQPPLLDNLVDEVGRLNPPTLRPPAA